MSLSCFPDSRSQKAGELGRMWFSFETSSLALGEAPDWGPGAWSWGGVLLADILGTCLLFPGAPQEAQSWGTAQERPSEPRKQAEETGFTLHQQIFIQSVGELNDILSHWNHRIHID